MSLLEIEKDSQISSDYQQQLPIFEATLISHTAYNGIEVVARCLRELLLLPDSRKIFDSIEVNGSLATHFDQFTAKEKPEIERDERQFTYLLSNYAILDRIAERYFAGLIDEIKIDLASYLYLHSCLQSSGPDISVKFKLKENINEEQALEVLTGIGDLIAKQFTTGQAHQISWHGRRDIVLIKVKNALFFSGQILFLFNSFSQDDSYNLSTDRRRRQIRPVYADHNKQPAIEARHDPEPSLEFLLQNQELGNILYHTARLIRSAVFDPPADQNLLKTEVILQALQTAQKNKKLVITPEQMVGVMANLGPVYSYQPELVHDLLVKTGMINHLPNYQEKIKRSELSANYKLICGQNKIIPLNVETYNFDYDYTENTNPQTHFSYLMQFCPLKAEEVKNFPFETVQTLIK